MTDYRILSNPEFFGKYGYDNKFYYQLLARMKSDCLYYLAYETNCKPEYNHLWAGHSPAAQIQYMKYLWNSFPDDEKPEWLTMKEIEDFEKKMILREDM